MSLNNQQGSTHSSSDNSPYPGLRPYREDEKDNFFGRDADREILVDKLLSNRLTLLFAATGVGKSSLLQAAVMPQLKDPLGENLSVIYHNDWVLNPIDSLKQSIINSIKEQNIPLKEQQTLPELLAFCTLFTRHPLVIILDQFEEFFRYQKQGEQFHEFIDQITTLVINTQIPLSLVISMREDFALELDAFKPKLPTLLFENYYRIDKLGEEAARDAIRIPAKRAGFSYEPALFDQLLKDLLSRDLDRAPSSLSEEISKTVEPPYIQIVCSQLWELEKDNPDKILRLKTYQNKGGAKGLLSNYVNDELSQFSDHEKDIASHAFDYLISRRGTKMPYTAEDLAEVIKKDEKELKKVLKKLTEKRILRPQKRGDSIWYELYHDMFSPAIESWNDAHKKQKLKKRRWIMGSIIGLLLLTLAFLIESFLWVLNHNFPANYLFKEQEFRLMNWGFIPESLPIMKKITVQKDEFTIGEQNEAFIATVKSQPDYMQNFGVPNRKVKLNSVYYAGQYEVSYEQYDYYVWQQLKAGIEARYPTSSVRDTRRGDKAVTYVSQEEAVAYTEWLSKKTGHNYRLPTEIEWEYAARGNTTTTYWWGDAFDEKMANCNSCSSYWSKEQLVAPVGQFKPNDFGIYDTAGNVWEWTCTEWQISLNEIKETCADDKTASSRRVVRGGAWNDLADWLRSSSRDWSHNYNRNDYSGFRVFRFPRQDE